MLAVARLVAATMSTVKQFSVLPRNARPRVALITGLIFVIPAILILLDLLWPIPLWDIGKSIYPRGKKRSQMLLFLMILTAFIPD
jgi:hypothetical protein